MSVPDRNERAQQRRRREARARNVLTAASMLSLAAGTATIYAANAGPSEADQPTSTPFAVLKPVLTPIPTATAVPSTPTPTAEPASDEGHDEEYDDDDDYEEREDESGESTSLPNITVPPTPAEAVTTSPKSTPPPEPTSTPTPEIVVEQPRSHSRSQSTPG